MEALLALQTSTKWQEGSTVFNLTSFTVDLQFAHQLEALSSRGETTIGTVSGAPTQLESTASLKMTSNAPLSILYHSLK